MGYSEMNCPHCGRMNRESCNAWMYGSPVRKCKSCGQKYLDKRWREPAIVGFDNRTTDPMLYLKASGVFLAGFIVCLAWLLYNVKFRGYYFTRQVALVALTAFGAIGCFVMFLRIKLGFAEKENEKYIAESEQRLRDKAYVDELISFGIDVPEKYR